jgi:hypothetical protein
MIIAAIYSHNGGQELMQQRYIAELAEIEAILAAVDGETYRTKRSQEKPTAGKYFYNPPALNKAIKSEFQSRNWQKHRERCDYSNQHYTPGYMPSSTAKGAFREMDFVRNRVGVEVQFGKYAFAIYNVCAKMTIFHKLGVIDVGVEIVPVKDLVDNMSTGITYFEQFVWDLEMRGVSNIDLPVLILGVASVYNPSVTVPQETILPDPETDQGE